MELIWVGSSPHVTKNHSTNTIVLDEIFALVPTMILGLVLFGISTMLNLIICIVSAILFDMISNLIYKQKFSLEDASSILTGLLIYFVLPPAAPVYMCIFATGVAVLLLKNCFGGFGAGFVCEIAIVRVLCSLIFGATFAASYLAPELSTAAVSSSPLIEIINNNGITPSFKDMFFGNFVGGFGETAIITLLIGGVYLCARRIIDYKVPLIYLATVALLVLIFKGVEEILPYLMSSGLVLGAFFIATDFSSCPNTLLGRIVYPIFLGAITFLIWNFGDAVNAVYYAIIIGGLVTCLISAYYKPRPYGKKRRV